MQPLKPLKSLACQVECGYRDTLIIGYLVEVKEMVDLEQPTEHVLAREQWDFDLG